ncbi:histidine phosphatase family protein [Sphingobium cloacae]|uniref:Phosphoglycerate mutase n=1 Tax=Sphingobium cloacae TaxID=120107 RepID=A0A1E1F2F2_9SPHN|nr:histidine phosphatase family protein [Sphingobium cloacae]BAV64695.1 phosphoglycerate mutase [Sphingobium cloacae]
MTRRIFIVRHGNTFESGAQARRIGAGTDIPLVASGRVQADRLGAWFAGQSIAIRHIFSGPLQRARETAERIGGTLGKSVDAFLPWLNEIDHGPDEGLPETEVLARIGADAIAAWDEQAIAPRHWRVDAEERIAAWRTYFAEEGEGADILVTSNGAARFALVALGLPLASLKLRTGAFGELTIEAGGQIDLRRWDFRP